MNKHTIKNSLIAAVFFVFFEGYFWWNARKLIQATTAYPDWYLNIGTWVPYIYVFNVVGFVLVSVLLFAGFLVFASRAFNHPRSFNPMGVVDEEIRERPE